MDYTKDQVKAAGGVILEVASRPVVLATAAGAGVGAVAVGAAGAVGGAICGGAAGAVVGAVPALFTFGLSVPVGVAIGGGTGICVGGASGASVGLAGGGAVALAGFHAQKSMQHALKRGSAGESGEDTKRSLLVVGGGPAGIQVVRQLARDFRVTLVEPKDYFEFTPGILRGICDLDHVRNLQVPFEEALAGLDVRHVRGKVEAMSEHAAEVRLTQDSPGLTGEAGSMITLSFDFAVVAAGSHAGNSLWKITGAPGEANETTLDGRVAHLAHMHQQLLGLRASGGCCLLVGAGLVGVELAAELASYFPGLRVVLADLAPSVLPALPKRAQAYANDWLVRNNVELRLGTPLPRGSDAEICAALGVEGDAIVLRCAGVSMQGSFMSSLRCLNKFGCIRTNRAMQVLSGDTDDGQGNVCGVGNIFAIGDCASIEGLAAPVTKDIYPAEAMVEVVVAYLRLALKLKGADFCTDKLRQMRASLQQMTLCSLGPSDCIFIMNGYVAATGRIATTMKNTIESTKVGQLRNKRFGSLVWSLVPHF